MFGDLITKLNEREELYLCPADLLISYTSNWIYNRPPDLERVNAISKTIDNDTYINTTIYIAELINGKKVSFVCYDGNHRREALKKYPRKKILVNLLRNAKNEEIVERFTIMNSGCPVPELFLEKTDDELKIIIDKLINYFCTEWKKHKSNSKNPRKPNFNRDYIMDILFSFLKGKAVDYSHLLTKILELNEKYKNGIHVNLSKFKPNVLKKCRVNNCFLFLKKDFTDDLIL